FLAGTYLILSEYSPLVAENIQNHVRTAKLIQRLEEIKEQEILNALIDKYRDDLRDLIREENEMIDQRMMWMLTLNGLLFTTLGFSWGRSRVLNWLPWILSGVGAISAVSFGFILQTGVKSIECTNELWLVLSKYSRCPLPPIIGLRNQDIIPYSRPLLPWNCLPLLLYSAWLTVALAIAIERWEMAHEKSRQKR
ncbi:MAG: hypothetical protein D3904_04645, partial [Candidatus Electrothrix sp. EH2]|nr:hypothetical protein [Candidatus Electrothrix sp. EH2]